MSMKDEYPELYNEMKELELGVCDITLNKILKIFSRLCWSCGSMQAESCQCENDE